VCLDGLADHLAFDGADGDGHGLGLALAEVAEGHAFDESFVAEILGGLRGEQLIEGAGGRLHGLGFLAGLGRLGEAADVLGEEGGQQDGAVRGHHGLLDDVLQFAHVAGPVVAEQPADGPGMEGTDVPTEFAVERGHDVVGHEDDIDLAFAERGQVDGDDTEPVVEVLSEEPLVDAALEILVGGGDDAGIAGDEFVPADAVEGAVLDEAQELGLQVGAHVADFIEEHGATLGLFEATDTAGVGAGERALLVAEEFGLEQRFGDGGAVDGDERAVLPFAVFVEGTADEFLAGPRLAGDEHIDIESGDHADAFEDLLHGGRLADEAVLPRGGAAADAEAPEAAALAEVGLLHDDAGIGEDASETSAIDRLEEVLPVAVACGGHRVFGVARRRDHDGDEPVVLGAEQREPVVPAWIGEVAIDDEQLPAFGVHEAQDGREILGDGDVGGRVGGRLVHHVDERIVGGADQEAVRVDLA
jgi:hypothetical protein